MLINPFLSQCYSNLILKCQAIFTRHVDVLCMLEWWYEHFQKIWRESNRLWLSFLPPWQIFNCDWTCIEIQKCQCLLYIWNCFPESSLYTKLQNEWYLMLLYIEILQKCMKLIIHKILLNPQSYNSYYVLRKINILNHHIRSIKIIVNDNIRCKYG